MIALIDADLLRYECCYAAQAAYKQMTDTDDNVNFDAVQDALDYRIKQITIGAGCDRVEPSATTWQSLPHTRAPATLTDHTTTPT